MKTKKMMNKEGDYTGFEFEDEGFPALAIINKDLKSFEGKQGYSHAVFIQVVPDRFNEYGHPEGEEYDYLNEVEKTIMDYLLEQTETVHVGHTTMYRSRQIIFYTKNREAVETYLEHFLSTIERENSVEVEYDPEWESVSAFYDLL